MWQTGSRGDGDGPDPELVRRMGPPDNEIPVALPLNAVLARSEDAAVALVGLQVYSTGVGFTVAARVRPSAGGGPSDLAALMFEHSGRPGRFLLGVELADGRRIASGPPWWGRGGDAVLTTGSGGGGPSAVDQSWWLAPLPPPGPLRVVVRCPELGLEETVTELDGSAIRQAAAQVVRLWPWEPPRELGAEPPPPPDVPDGSWFAGRA